MAKSSAQSSQGLSKVAGAADPNLSNRTVKSGLSRLTASAHDMPGESSIMQLATATITSNTAVVLICMEQQWGSEAPVHHSG